MMKQRKQAFLTLIMLSFILFIYSPSTFGQAGINTSDPQTTLDVTAGSGASDIAGIQAPRLTLAELSGKGNSLYGSNQKGAIIYITDITGGGNTGQRVNITIPGYYYFDGSNWQKFGFLAPYRAFGSIKESFKTSDHNGWYLLDGRAVSSFPSNLQAVLVGLGFSSNLPDATDRVLKTKIGSEALGSIGGTNNLFITQSNLPNLTFSGTFSGTVVNGGAHTHTFSVTSASTTHTHTFSATSTNSVAHSHSVALPLRQNNNHIGNASGRYNMAGAQTGTTGSAGDHNHTFSGTSGSGDVAHTHTVTGTAASGGAAHTHAISGTASVPMGGSGTALDNRSAYLVVNTFIYLGL